MKNSSTQDDLSPASPVAEKAEKLAPKATKGAVFWMLVPVVLLVTSVSGWLVMVNVAVSDPGFSVEPDYYKKASNYDDVLLQRGENSRLGYSVTFEKFEAPEVGSGELVLRVRDRLGEDLVRAEVSAVGFPVARGDQIHEGTFRETEPGTYALVWDKARPGVWELRVTVVTSEGTFTETLRGELTPAAHGSLPLSGRRAPS